MISTKWKLIACGALFLLCSGCSRDPVSATLSYWNQVIVCSTFKAEKQPDERSQAAADARARATAIENLPTAGVDIEASRIALTGARLQREYAELVTQEGYLPALVFMDGFMWGLTGQGTPFDTAAQYSGTLSAWSSRFQAWSNDSQQVRVELTHKYGKEFPILVRYPATASSSGSATAQKSLLSQWWSELSWFTVCAAIVVIYSVANHFFGDKTKKTS